MTRVVVPDGAVIEVVPSWKQVDPLTTNRTTRYRFDLLDDTGKKFGDLDGVSGGSLEWNANAQVKGGGRISVSKANDVHKREIRVAKNLPLLDERDFELDTEGFVGNGEFTDYIEDPGSITRSTDTFYEGAAALDIGWKTPGVGKTAQNVISLFEAGITPGVEHTFVARVLNTNVPTARLKVSFLAEGLPIPMLPDWQTISVTFVPLDPWAYFGVYNWAPVADTHTFLDSVDLYEGEATGFNGETFEYAPFSWLHARVRPVLVVDGVPEEPLGVFVPSAPVEQWDEGGGKQTIELLDRTSVLSQDYVPATYTVKKNTNIIAAVRKLIASTGEPVGALTESEEIVSADMMWGAGTNKLTIVNELLAAAGFFALWADGNGQFRVEEYRSPKSRPVSFALLDGARSIYTPDLSIDRDIYDIPNRVIMTAQGSGESEGWTAVATNTNKDSPFSYNRRGRWVTNVQLGVEATSENNLYNKAVTRLQQLSSTQATVEIRHAPVPGLRANQVVRLRRTPADLDTLFTVTKTGVDFDPTALARTTLTEVVDLD